MTSTVLIQNLRAQAEALAQDDLEDQFELFKNLKSKSIRDELFQEILAQELDKRESLVL
jgi:hypothetical protein